MITAEELRKRTKKARKTGELDEYRQLQTILENLEPRICKAADNSNNSVLFRSNHMDYLTTEQMREFIQQYFSKSDITVKFSEKMSLVFWLCW